MTILEVPATVTKVAEIVKSGALSAPVRPIAAAQGVADRQARREARVAALLARRDSLHAELARNMQYMGNTAWLRDRIELMESINADLAHEGWGPADVK